MSIQAILVLCWSLGFVFFYIRMTDPEHGLDPFDEGNWVLNYFGEVILMLVCAIWPLSIPFFRSRKD